MPCCIVYICQRLRTIYCVYQRIFIYVLDALCAWCSVCLMHGVLEAVCMHEGTPSGFKSFSHVACQLLQYACMGSKYMALCTWRDNPRTLFRIGMSPVTRKSGSCLHMILCLWVCVSVSVSVSVYVCVSVTLSASVCVSVSITVSISVPVSVILSVSVSVSVSISISCRYRHWLSLWTYGLNDAGWVVRGSPTHWRRYFTHVTFLSSSFLSFPLSLCLSHTAALPTYSSALLTLSPLLSLSPFPSLSSSLTLFCFSCVCACVHLHVLVSVFEKEGERASVCVCVSLRAASEKRAKRKWRDSDVSQLLHVSARHI